MLLRGWSSGRLSSDGQAPPRDGLGKVLWIYVLYSKVFLV